MVWRTKGFTEPRLLLCEGPDDVVFFQRLIEARGLHRFHISDTSTPEVPNGGNTGFERALRSARFNPNFQAIRTILVVSDSDADPTASFSAVCDQIEAAGYSRPAEALRATTGRPAIIVAMLPLDGEPGNLEAFCVAAADSANAQIAGVVQTFANMLHAENWPKTREGKLRLRASLAARCERDPFVFLGQAFRDQPELIPLSHQSFDALAALLDGLT